MFEAPGNDRKFIHAEVNKALAIWTGKAMPGWAEKGMEQQQLRGQWHFLGCGCCGNAPQILSGIMLGLDQMFSSLFAI